MLRPVILKRYLTVMQAKGHRSSDVVGDCDIDLNRLDDENYLIDLATFHRIVENMVILSGDGGIGIDIGLAHQLEDFGILAFASMSGINQYRNAEEIWNRFGESVGIMTRLSIRKIGADLLGMDIEVLASNEATYRFFVEELIALHYSIGAEWIGRAPVVKTAQFSYPAPSYVRRYEVMLNCPIKFNAPRTRITIESNWYEQPIKTQNLELRSLVERQLENLRKRITASTPLISRVRDVFLHRQGEIVKIDEAARELRLSTRTLSRQLQSRGLSYQKILDEFLAETSRELIHRKPDKTPIKEISIELGFSDVNAFRRAFKRWNGITVQEYRHQISCKS